jgi:hypothetical protein
MCVIARINQLCFHPNLVGGTLHAAFHHISNAQLLSDPAQAARDSALVLQHGGAADHFQIGNLGQVCQDFVLHPIGEKGVIGIGAQIMEG